MTKKTIKLKFMNKKKLNKKKLCIKLKKQKQFFDFTTKVYKEYFSSINEYSDFLLENFI